MPGSIDLTILQSLPSPTKRLSTLIFYIGNRKNFILIYILPSFLYTSPVIFVDSFVLVQPYMVYNNWCQHAARKLKNGLYWSHPHRNCWPHQAMVATILNLKTDSTHRQTSDENSHWWTSIIPMRTGEHPKICCYKDYRHSPQPHKLWTTNMASLSTWCNVRYQKIWTRQWHQPFHYRSEQRIYDQVKPELTNHSQMEDKFVKIAKQLLTKAFSNRWKTFNRTLPPTSS